MIYFQVSEALQPEGDAWPPAIQFDQAALLRAAQETLALAQGDSEPDLTILMSDDEQLRLLNAQYLGIDSPTDVLSFPAGDRDPDTEAVYLGDVILSYPRAQAQAAAAGHAVTDELQLLVVHGVLHLLGYDHADEEDRERMWQIQAEVLGRLGLGDLQITE